MWEGSAGSLERADWNKEVASLRLCLLAFGGPRKLRRNLTFKQCYGKLCTYKRKSSMAFILSLFPPSFLHSDILYSLLFLHSAILTFFPSVILRFKNVRSVSETSAWESVAPNVALGCLRHRTSETETCQTSIAARACLSTTENVQPWYLHRFLL